MIESVPCFLYAELNFLCPMQHKIGAYSITTYNVKLLRIFALTTYYNARKKSKLIFDNFNSHIRITCSNNIHTLITITFTAVALFLKFFHYFLY